MMLFHFLRVVSREGKKTFFMFFLVISGPFIAKINSKLHFLAL